MERYFSVPVKISHALVLHRLEFRNATTRLSAPELSRYHAEMDALLPALRPDVCFSMVPIERRDERRVSCAGGFEIASRSAAKLTAKSRRLLLMGATSPGAAPLIEAAERSGDLARAAFIDAVASEATDAGLDWISDMLGARLLRERARLTARFSAGYGDVPLSLQRELFALLDFGALGVSISDRYLLTPQKSVLAFAGIEG